ncbi:MAG TPA: hypothetical protein VGO33_14395, partial [Gemmatimonadaceae bacterium]|nr:hypothetical protein [Gemmatimonadaceae bacterium]
SRVAGSPAMTIAGGRVGRTLAAVVVLLIALFAARSLAVVSVVGAVAAVVIATAAFSVACWSWILRDVERTAIARTLGTYRRGLLPLS